MTDPALREEIEAVLAKATPGPWAIDPGSDGQDLIAYTPNAGAPWTVRAYIASIRWNWMDNWFADMKLICRAPDFLRRASAALSDRDAEIARAVEAERERCAVIADKWLSASFARLHAGELTAQEVRTVQAVAKSIAAGIRSGK